MEVLLLTCRATEINRELHSSTAPREAIELEGNWAAETQPKYRAWLHGTLRSMLMPVAVKKGLV